jgi:hypothetical protein
MAASHMCQVLPMHFVLRVLHYNDKAVNMVIAYMCMHVCFGCCSTIFTAGRNVWCIHCML